MADELVAGLYERLLTATLHDALSDGLGLEAMSDDVGATQEPLVLTRYLAGVIHEALIREKDSSKRLELANALLQRLRHDDEVLDPARELLSLSPPPRPGQASFSLVRPATRLSDPALLTNAPAEPSIGSELQKEMPSANRVDLLCAFVKWHGVRVLEDQLRDLRERGIPLRVVTNTYMGATERRALDRLVRDFGAEVRIQYDALRTRLHAKAWLFERDTGFDTAYVGSSNLSRAAMLDGLEWNVRLSSVATPTLLDKFRATFESSWHDRSFEPYDPDADAERLDAALAQAGTGTRSELSRPLRPGCAALPVPAGNSRGAGGGARGASPAPQPRRRSHWNRQDRHRCTGLPRTRSQRRGRKALTAVRSAPSGDPAAVAADVSGSAGRRELR